MAFTAMSPAHQHSTSYLINRCISDKRRFFISIKGRSQRPPAAAVSDPDERARNTFAKMLNNIGGISSSYVIISRRKGGKARGISSPPPSRSFVVWGRPKKYIF